VCWHHNYNTVTSDIHSITHCPTVVRWKPLLHMFTFKYNTVVSGSSLFPIQQCAWTLHCHLCTRTLTAVCFLPFQQYMCKNIFAILILFYLWRKYLSVSVQLNFETVQRKQLQFRTVQSETEVCVTAPAKSPLILETMNSTFSSSIIQSFIFPFIPFVSCFEFTHSHMWETRTSTKFPSHLEVVLTSVLKERKSSTVFFPSKHKELHYSKKCQDFFINFLFLKLENSRSCYFNFYQFKVRKYLYSL
jgi:hypothetical protein